jgi:hypothetical protein
MVAMKPKPEHPWRKNCIIKREVSQHINQSITNARVNTNKIGGGLPSWNGRK